MADITRTKAQVAMVHPQACEVFDFIANEAIEAGQPVYQLTTRKVGLADANAAGLQQFRGLALKSVGAGQAVSVLKKGTVEGFDLSSLDGDARVYLSDTVGELADAAGTMTVPVGRVFGLSDNDLSRYLYVEADWLGVWS